MGWVKLFLLLLYVIFYSLDLRKKKKQTHGTECERLIKAKSEWVKFMSSEVSEAASSLPHP